MKLPTPKTALRALVAADWVVLLAGAVCVLALDLPLPAELQAYVDRQEELSAESHPLWWLVAIPVLLGSIIASVGLWFFRRWARALYALIVVSGIIMTAIDGPVAHHALAEVFTAISSLVAGAILGLAYFARIEGLQRTTA